MKRQTTQEFSWTQALREAVVTGSDERVAEVFSLLTWQGGERISVRAKTFLEQFPPTYFAEKGLTAAMIEDRLRCSIGTFRSFLRCPLHAQQDRAAPPSVATESVQPPNKNRYGKDALS